MNQFGIDVFVYNECFKSRAHEKPNWTYIEAGANDGIRDSITIEFERQLGWSGILVEPIPQLLDVCKTHRSADKNLFLNCGLGSEYGYFDLTVPRMNLDNASFAMSQAHLDQLDGFGQLAAGIVQISCLTLTYADVCRLNGHKPIDLLVLDVEGFENPILERMVMDIHEQKVAPPTVVVCEHFWSDQARMREIMSEHYDLIKTYEHDYVFHLK